jgi:hypothetical protein
VDINVSEEFAASIFKVKISMVKMKVIWAAAKKNVTQTKPTHITVSASTPKVEAGSLSETLVSTYKTARCNNPEDHILRNNCRNNLKNQFK